MQTLSPKDPSEQITVTFDFSALLSAIATVSVVCVPVKGVDASAAAMLSGSPVAASAVVRQVVINGVDGVTYSLRCTATGPEGKFILSGWLPVVSEV